MQVILSESGRVVIMETPAITCTPVQSRQAFPPSWVGGLVTDLPGKEEALTFHRRPPQVIV